MQPAAGRAFFLTEYKRARLLSRAALLLVLVLALALAGCGAQGDGAHEDKARPGAGQAEGPDRPDPADKAGESLPDRSYPADKAGERLPDRSDPADKAGETLPEAAAAQSGEVQRPADSRGNSEVPATALQPGTGTAGYTAPAALVSSFRKDRAKGENGVLIDLSSASDGYIGVSASSKGRVKFQSLKDGNTYTYDLKSDGTPSIFPLQMEDGMYTFRVLENVSGTKYAVLYSTDETISIADQFRPFLCSNDYVKYTDASACVKKAQEFAAGAADANGVITAVYDYVCAGVTYDKEKAKTVQAGYVPDPDETLATGKGICFDYASLAACMLRSQGIPCKLIFGYVSPNEVYHAWNMFYTEENGWITVKFEISGKKWNRMDLTFSANGADGNFIGDGSNYKDVYCY